MKKVLLLLLFLFTSLLAETEQMKTVKLYSRLFGKLSVEQKMIFIASYKSGAKEGLGITQAAIVWKESTYGKHLINDKDGQFGSFGIGQILLTTSMLRHNVTSIKDRIKLREKLLTDNTFNLKEGLEELKYWRKVHRDIYKRKQWLKWTIASYNNGNKSYETKKGQKYANDVMLRMEAIKHYFKNYEGDEDNKILTQHFLVIKYHMFPELKNLKNRGIEKEKKAKEKKETKPKPKSKPKKTEKKVEKK